MKHYIDIQRARFDDEGMSKYNLGRFEVGDRIVIQEKWDGANGSILYEDGKLKCFSRKRELDERETLRGFWNYVQKLDASKFADLGNRIIFLEWGASHTIKYNPEAYNQAYVFDMYDTETKQWLPQDVVKEFTESHGFNYIHTYYDGPFISWEHCMSFLHSPGYGNEQEGIVCKLVDKLDYADDERNPAYIKIVNAQFKETQLKNHIKKVIDPQNLEEKRLAEEHANEFVTEARVKKEIGKMIDEGILPEDILPKDMGIVASNLPKRVYADIDKEDHDTLIAYGNQYLDKAISAVTMGYARKIILGE